MRFCLCYVHVLCPKTAEVCVRSPRTGLMDVCEPLNGCWDPNSPLEEQHVLLTIKQTLLKAKFQMFFKLLKTDIILICTEKSQTYKHNWSIYILSDCYWASLKLEQ